MSEVFLAYCAVIGNGMLQEIMKGKPNTPLNGCPNSAKYKK